MIIDSMEGKYVSMAAMYRWSLAQDQLVVQRNTLSVNVNVDEATCICFMFIVMDLKFVC